MFTMKLLHYTKIAATAFCLALLMTACAGGASPEEAVNGENANNAENGNEVGFNENANNLNDNNMGNDNMGNDNNMGNNNMGNDNNMGNNDNNLLNNENLGGNAGAAEPANEFLNNAAGENFLGSNNPSTPATDGSEDLGATQNSTEDLGIQSSNGIVGGNQDTGVTVAPPNANMGATDTSLAPNQVARPASGGTVRYVLKGGAKAYNQPHGKIVRNFEQGDHPLVSADGEWVRTSDGTFVSSSDVTTRPIPRAKSPKPWR